MSEGEKSGEARRALVDSVKGKAKEIFGAVTGNDSLTAEGQLDQLRLFVHHRRPRRIRGGRRGRTGGVPGGGREAQRLRAAPVSRRGG